MLPLKLSGGDPESVRRSFKIVRMDSLDAVAPNSLILWADVASGKFLLRHHDSSSMEQEYDFGPQGIRIVKK